MKRHIFRPFVLALTLAAPLALAQERGRTDGPEGSEIGKGGYQDPGSGRFSLELNWGASFTGGVTGVPLFAGATGSFWVDDWMLIDLSGLYNFNGGGAAEVLVGPRFRTAATYPVSAYLGLKAGPIFTSTQLFFGVSPQAGFDIVVADRAFLGLGYALDIPVASGFLIHRLHMNIGYRF